MLFSALLFKDNVRMTEEKLKLSELSKVFPLIVTWATGQLPPQEFPSHYFTFFLSCSPSF